MSIPHTACRAIKKEVIDILPTSEKSVTPMFEVNQHNVSSLPLKVKIESQSKTELEDFNVLSSSRATNIPLMNENQLSCCSDTFSNNFADTQSSPKAKPYVETTRLQNEMGKYQCSLCPLSYKQRTLLMNHERLSHNINNESELPFDCSQCSRRFDKLKQLQLHHRLHSSCGRKCRVCDLPEFATYQERIDHEQQNHFNAAHNRWTCQNCPKTFDKLTELRNHGTTHTETRTFICDECGYSAKRKADLIRHLAIHRVVRTFPCHMCPDNKTFMTAECLKSHIKHFHLKKYKYACDKCDKVFTYSTSRRRHQRTHGGIEKKLVCSECDRRFYEPNDLRLHKKSHNKYWVTTKCTLKIDNNNNI